jgi:hypothetical protein
LRKVRGLAAGDMLLGVGVGVGVGGGGGWVGNAPL